MDKVKMTGAKMKWKVLESTEVAKTRFFTVRSDKCELADGRVFPSYLVLDVKDWVNIVPVTSAGEIILIRQYRHASGELSIEIPGGAIDHHKSENPQDAAVRELIEETGYKPKEVKLLGSHDPNPALQTNKMWSYIAFGCEDTGRQNLDEFEEIEVFRATINETMHMIRNGQIRHSLVIAAIHLALPYLENLKPLGV